MQDRAVQEGVEPIAILRALGRHFQRLHACAGLMAEGAPLDGAMKALRPPIFFRQADAFRAQLRLWGPADVNRALDWLTSAEKDCKSTGFPAETICHQTLLRLAASARALAGRRRR
jgi:DNA polymerase-3 subunit delta